MIKIFLGLPGSGKTASAVRMILKNPDITYYSNIITKKLKNNIVITKDMIIKETPILKDDKTPKVKDHEPVMKLSVNKDYWENLDKSKRYNLILDEAHTIMNPRRSMSRQNQIIMQFLAMIRRVLGASESSQGDLILITQLSRGLEIYAREMSTKVFYHRCHYHKRCKRCLRTYYENNEFPDILERCRFCKSPNLEKINMKIEILEFIGLDALDAWKISGAKTYYKRYIVKNIEEVFPLYNTLQWDNLIVDY